MWLTPSKRLIIIATKNRAQQQQSFSNRRNGEISISIGCWDRRKSSASQDPHSTGERSQRRVEALWPTAHADRGSTAVYCQPRATAKELWLSYCCKVDASGFLLWHTSFTSPGMGLCEAKIPFDLRGKLHTFGFAMKAPEQMSLGRRTLQQLSDRSWQAANRTDARSRPKPPYQLL